MSGCVPTSPPISLLCENIKTPGSYSQAPSRRKRTNREGLLKLLFSAARVSPIEYNPENQCHSERTEQNHCNNPHATNTSRGLSFFDILKDPLPACFNYFYKNCRRSGIRREGLISLLLKQNPGGRLLRKAHPLFKNVYRLVLLIFD